MIYILEFYGPKGWEVWAETEDADAAVRWFRVSAKNGDVVRITSRPK